MPSKRMFNITYVAIGPADPPVVIENISLFILTLTYSFRT